MEKLKPRTLSGFMELLPAPQQKFERMLEILRKNFALYGFTPIDTPIIESAEILLAKGGGETEKQIYRFQKGDWPCASTTPFRWQNTSPCMRMSSASRSGAMPLARFTAASAPSAAASANSIRPISTSSATASSPSSTRRKFRPLFIRYSRSSA